MSLMPFGKHRGTRVTDCPESYLRWLTEQDWFKEKFPALFDEASGFLNKWPKRKKKRKRKNKSRRNMHEESDAVLLTDDDSTEEPVSAAFRQDWNFPDEEPPF